MKVDVLIVGTGPAGGMAACQLASSGLRVLILEKETLPRHKPCGGGISATARDAFVWDLTPVIDCEVTGFKYLHNFEQVKVEMRMPLLMVDRSRFDAHLVKHALSLGKGAIVLRDGFRVVHAEETGRSVWVQGETGERVEADYLVAADGARSRIGRCLGLGHRAKYGVALDAEIEVSAETYQAERPYATFNFFCLPHGYGWIFPKEDGRLSCGVCAWRGRPNLRKALDRFLDRSFAPQSVRSVKSFGGLLPIYSGHQEIATRRVCLVGDAASLVDPIMGDGIGFALRSGALAARTIVGLMGDGADVGQEGSPIPKIREGCRAYQSMIHGVMGKELDGLRRFIQPIFVRDPQYFYRKFILDGHSYRRLAQGLAALAEKKSATGQASAGRP